MLADGVDLKEMFYSEELHAMIPKEEDIGANDLSIKLKIICLSETDWIVYKSKITEYLKRNKITFEVQE